MERTDWGTAAEPTRTGSSCKVIPARPEPQKELPRSPPVGHLSATVISPSASHRIGCAEGAAGPEPQRELRRSPPLGHLSATETSVFAPPARCSAEERRAGPGCRGGPSGTPPWASESRYLPANLNSGQTGPGGPAWAPGEPGLCRTFPRALLRAKHASERRRDASPASLGRANESWARESPRLPAMPLHGRGAGAGARWRDKFRGRFVGGVASERISLYL